MTLWWLAFFTALGLCLGSFLNVVIYRLPNDKSLRSPVWSFCPSCRRPIRWYDNLPVVSFLLLRGRCRDCAVPIPTRYPLIEIMMALVVLVLVDALFIGHTRAGVFDSKQLGITESIAFDWPILTAHIVLFACLLAMSAIDLEHYWVDIRFTNFAVIVGFAAHTLWTPNHSMDWIRPSDTTAVVSLFALIGLTLTWLVFVCQPHADPEDFSEIQVHTEDVPAAPLPSRLPPSLQSPSRTAVWVAGSVLVLLFVLLVIHGSGTAPLRQTGRALIPLALFFLVIVGESVVPRASDEAVVEAIHEERYEARRMVLEELAILLPALVLGLIGLWLMTRDDTAARVSQALHGEIRVPGLALLRHWSPLVGFTTAASGYIIAGAIGWLVRIVFTLFFGKEAFGAGDIHMMAAAGCVAGWPVVLLGFFLTCGLALIGWIIALPFKRTRAVPLGPWLSLAILAVVVYYDAIIQWPIIARAVEAAQWLLMGAPTGR